MMTLTYYLPTLLRTLLKASRGTGGMYQSCFAIAETGTTNQNIMLSSVIDGQQQL
jgi:hypothetical protein